MFPTQYQLTAVGCGIGFVAALLIAILQAVWDPQIFLMDQPQSYADYIAFASAHGSQLLGYYALDTIFIIGYTSLFVGTWFIVRDFGDALPTIPLSLSMLVTAGDILENALHMVVINGAMHGVNLDYRLLNWAWTINLVIDIASYLAAIFFTMLLLSIWRPPQLKFLLGLLLLFYVLVGIVCLLYPPFLLVRNVVFVVGLGIGGFILSKQEDIPLEELEKILHRSRDTQDYIR